MSRVAIIDYGMCNLGSVARAVEECGATAIVTDDAREIETASRIILPGVGAFPDGMRNLRERSLDVILSEQVSRGIPLLGICLGMQLLAKKGYEVEECEGLGWLDAEVVRLRPRNGDTRIPHVGWNELDFQRLSPLFESLSAGDNFYFVHSFHMACRDEKDVLATTPYCGGFVSAVARNNVWGVQFHPEKSQKKGFQLLRNFLGM